MVEMQPGLYSYKALDFRANWPDLIFCQVTVEFCTRPTGVTVFQCAASEEIIEDFISSELCVCLNRRGTMQTILSKVQASVLLLWCWRSLLLAACCLLPAGCVPVVECFPRCWAEGRDGDLWTCQRQTESHEEDVRVLTSSAFPSGLALSLSQCHVVCLLIHHTTNL